jgi:hypothetical protein
LKFSLHNSKTFFNFPSALIYFNNSFSLIVKTCTDSIKTVVHFFFNDGIFVNIVNCFISNFTIFCCMVGFYKTLRVILPFLFHCFCTVLDGF